MRISPLFVPYLFRILFRIVVSVCVPYLSVFFPYVFRILVSHLFRIILHFLKIVHLEAVDGTRTLQVHASVRLSVRLTVQPSVRLSVVRMLSASLSDCPSG